MGKAGAKSQEHILTFHELSSSLAVVLLFFSCETHPNVCANLNPAKKFPGFWSYPKHNLPGATTAQPRTKGSRSKHLTSTWAMKCLAEKPLIPETHWWAEMQTKTLNVRLWPEGGYESYSRSPLSPCTTCPQHIPALGDHNSFWISGATPGTFLRLRSISSERGEGLAGTWRL